MRIKIGIGVVWRCGVHYGEKFYLIFDKNQIKFTVGASLQNSVVKPIQKIPIARQRCWPPFRRVFLHPRPNGRPNRLKARFSATVRVNYPPFPPELSAVRITDRVSGTRVRIPLPSGSTPCASIPAYRHKLSSKMPFFVVLRYTFSAYRA